MLTNLFDNKLKLMKCYQNINKIFHSFHISTSSPPACHLCHVGKTALIGPPVFERVIAPGDGDFWEISSWACPLSCIWVILLENFIEHVGQWRCAWLICSTALFLSALSPTSSALCVPWASPTPNGFPQSTSDWIISCVRYFSPTSK